MRRALTVLFGLLAMMLVPVGGAAATTPGVARLENFLSAGATHSTIVPFVRGSRPQVYGDNEFGLVSGALQQPEAWAVASGYHHVLALVENGNVFGWGHNEFGQIGDRIGVGTTSANPTPQLIVSNITGIAGGGWHSLLITNHGRLLSLGNNAWGQLGRAEGFTTSNPVSTPALVDGLTNVVAAAGGNTHSLAVRSDGSVWSWGDNTFGQLGRSVAGGYTRTAGRVPGISSAIAVAAGQNHSIALLRDGTVFAWGSNQYGQLGRSEGAGTQTPQQTPFAVAGVAAAKQVAVGFNHTLVLQNDGKVAAFGLNAFGQLGHQTNTSSVAPNPVPQILSWPETFKAIGAGGNHSLAATHRSPVIAWGRNNAGQTGGRGDNSPHPQPSQISGALGASTRMTLLADSITSVNTRASGAAALVNLTMANGQTSGYITADLCESLAPGPQAKSNGNHSAFTAIANLSVVPINSDGAFCLYNQQRVHLITDLQGVFSTSGALAFDQIAPTRLIDTRLVDLPAPFAITRVETGQAGAAAALVNLTMTDSTAAGYLTADRCSTLVAGPQTKSNGNFPRNFPIANLSVVPLDADGSFCVLSDAPVHRTIDLQGVFTANGATRFSTLSATRILDTRSGPRVDVGSITKVLTGQAGVTSVLVNLTIAAGTGRGYITADRCSALSAEEQTKSNGNFAGGPAIANLSVVPVDADGSFCIYASNFAHLVVDLQGTFSPSGTLRFDAVAPTRVLDTRTES